VPDSVYIIQSLKDGSYYIGYAADPDLRLQRHNDGWTKSTKSKIPWRLVYTEIYDSKSEAIVRERQIKSWKSHKEIDKLIACHARGRPRFDIVKPRRKTGHFALDIIKSDDIFYDE
jgi:putative endonuclease